MFFYNLTTLAILGSQFTSCQTKLDSNQSQLPLSEEELSEILRDLDSNSFRVREAGSRRLREVFENSTVDGIKNLKKELNKRSGSLSLEVRRRIEFIINREDYYLERAAIRGVGQERIRTGLNNLANENQDIITQLLNVTTLHNPQLYNQLNTRLVRNSMRTGLYRHALGLPEQRGVVLPPAFRGTLQTLQTELVNLIGEDLNRLSNPEVLGDPPLRDQITLRINIMLSMRSTTRYALGQD